MLIKSIIGKYPIPANVHVIETFLESPKGKQETDDLGEEPFEDNRCTPATDGDILGNSTMLEGDENSKNASESRTDRNLDVLTETPDTDVDTIEPNDDKEFSSPSEGSPDIMEEGSESEDEELEDLDCQKVLFSFRSGSVLDQDSTSAGINRTGSISTVVDEHEESESNVLENDAEVATTGTSPADGNDIKDPEIEDMVTDPESATVSTTLNLSTLAGDDAELFTEFLSRAKAKRAANCAMTPNGSTSLAESDLVTHSPTPRTRRALEQLDKNSPTPQKKQRSTKSETPLTSPPPRADTEESGCSENGPEKTGTTTCRRSNRTRTAKTTRSHAAPNVPQQIPVRRANGTEFIFLSRTEAQQIALVTRANTRRNRGNAQMPKYKLQDMAKQQGEMAEAAMSPEAGDSTASAGKPIGKKQVSWNEQHLVQYADGTDPEDDNPAVVVESKGKTGKGHSTSNTSQLPKRVSTPKPTKRVRRLGTPSSSSVISSTSGHTPVAKRTKLTPRSPKVDATASSTRSKKTLTSRANGTGQFLPMRSGRKASAVK